MKNLLSLFVILGATLTMFGQPRSVVGIPGPISVGGGGLSSNQVYEIVIENAVNPTNGITAATATNIVNGMRTEATFDTGGNAATATTATNFPNGIPLTQALTNGDTRYIRLEGGAVTLNAGGSTPILNFERASHNTNNILSSDGIEFDLGADDVTDARIAEEGIYAPAFFGKVDWDNITNSPAVLTNGDTRGISFTGGAVVISNNAGAISTLSLSSDDATSASIRYGGGNDPIAFTKGGNFTGDLIFSGQLIGSLDGGTNLPVTGIAASGTPSASTFLRGDGSWEAAGSGGVATNIFNDTNSVYLSARTDGQAGTGILIDPYDASTASKLHSVWPSFNNLSNRAVTFLPGQYYITNKLVITNATNIRVSGYGAKIWLTNSAVTAGISMITVADSTNVLVEGLYLDCGTLVTCSGSGKTGGVFYDDARKSVLRDVTVAGTDTTGGANEAFSLLITGTELVVDRCSVINPKGDYISAITTVGGEIQVVNNYIDLKDNDPTSQMFGISPYCSNSIVSGNTVLGTTHAIHVDAAAGLPAGTTFTNVVFSGNYLKASARTIRAYVTGGQKFYNWHFAGNVIWADSQWATLTSDDPTNTMISDFVFIANSFVGPATNANNFLNTTNAVQDLLFGDNYFSQPLALSVPTNVTYATFWSKVDDNNWRSTWGIGDPDPLRGRWAHDTIDTLWINSSNQINGGANRWDSSAGYNAGNGKVIIYGDGANEGNITTQGTITTEDLQVNNDATVVGDVYANAFYPTNTYYITNALPGDIVIPSGRVSGTNISANLTVTGFSGVDHNYWRGGMLWVTNDGATDRSITFQTGTRMATNSFVLANVVWCTNRAVTIISHGVGFNTTNVAAAAFY